MVMDLLGTSGIAHTLVKGLLMPALLLWVVVALGAAAPRLLVAGLVLATVGDVGLEYDATFLLGMAGFLAMQVCYIAGFIRLGAEARTSRLPLVTVGYLAFWAIANLILGPRLGDLRIPIAVYSMALSVMAIAAARTGIRRIAIGGLLFLVSDMLIGVDLADLGFPGRGIVVMVTYLGAQYLIATGWARRVDPHLVVPL
jgi:uncharacterized membrane protein YhhN